MLRARSKSASVAGDQLEHPAGEKLLDRAVEPHRGELRVDVLAKGARSLAVGDDLGDHVVGAADLRQVGAPERVRRPGHLDDDHLHQVRVVAVGVDDEAGDRVQLLSRADRLPVDLLDRGEQQRPALGEQLVEDLVLGVEVVVDEPIGDPGLVGDVRDPAGVKALAREHVDRRVEDLAALVDRGGLSSMSAHHRAYLARTIRRAPPPATGRRPGGGWRATGACCGPGPGARDRDRRR